MSVQSSFEISEPCLLRKRKASRPLEVATSEGGYHATTKEHFNSILSFWILLQPLFAKDLINMATKFISL